MKKTISIILAVLAAASLLCSCSKKEPAENKKRDEKGIITQAEITESAAKAEEKTSAKTEEETTEADKKEEKSTESADKEKNSADTDIKEKVKTAYTDTLKKNEYDYSAVDSYVSNKREMPQYTLYDFDKDGIPELLIWDIRVASATARTITVYKYNSSSAGAEPIGTITDFEGHSILGESADLKGIVLSVRDSGEDKITKYTLQNGALVSEVILKRNGESDSDWNNAMTDSKYMSAYEFVISNEPGTLYQELD